jgi:putative transposase
VGRCSLPHPEIATETSPAPPPNEPIRRYQSSLLDSEWDLIEPFLFSRLGRPPVHSRRQVLDGIFYVKRTGCQWRMLPSDFPPWTSVYGQFSRWTKSGLWAELNDVFRMITRIVAGREHEEPTAGVIDSQSAKTTELGGTRGYDAGKKINGRKRHILVDTLGLLITVVVHSASIQDRDGAKLVFEKANTVIDTLRLIWADGGYAGELVAWTKNNFNWILEIVRRPDEAKGFVLLKRRWVVERTFAWLLRSRRLSKDYERLETTEESWVYLSMIRLMLRRLART